MRASEARPVDAPREIFFCDVGWVSRHTLNVAYVGSVPATDTHARRIEQMVLSSDEPVGLCYDLRELTGFHRAQVDLHARTLARIASRVRGIALVGARPAARFGAVTVSLVARVPLANFDDIADAIAWLGAPERRFRASIGPGARLPGRRP
jgi:hypothetical protein